MKAAFPGYFPISESDSIEAWKNGLFSFDASVLLGLYRYSDDTRQELLKLLRALEGKLWITHRAALEFLNGRLGVIGTQSKQYQDSIVAIDSIQSTFDSARAHPFLSPALAEEAKPLFKKLRSYLIGKKSQIDQLILKDSIQEDVAALLEGRIGAPFEDDRLKSIFSEGEERYKAKIPPGYEDAKKPEGDARFGDLLIWSELIEKAAHEKKPITFVTADEKEDWWRIWQGKTIGPRPELVAEMRAKAGVAFQMFSPERFMEVASKKLSRAVKPTAIKEVKENRKAELSPETLETLKKWKILTGGPSIEQTSVLGLTGPVGSLPSSTVPGAFDAAGVFRPIHLTTGIDLSKIYGPTGAGNIPGVTDLAGIHSPTGPANIAGVTDYFGINGPAGPAGAVNVPGATDLAGIEKWLKEQRIANPSATLGGVTGLSDPLEGLRRQVEASNKQIEELRQQLGDLGNPPTSDPGPRE